MVVSFNLLSPVVVAKDLRNLFVDFVAGAMFSFSGIQLSVVSRSVTLSLDSGNLIEIFAHRPAAFGVVL